MAGITLETAKRHLDAWLEAELAVTNAQSYTIGSRTMTKANLTEIRKSIEYCKGKSLRLKMRQNMAAGTVQNDLYHGIYKNIKTS